MFRLMVFKGDENKLMEKGLFLNLFIYFLSSEVLEMSFCLRGYVYLVVGNMEIYFYPS